MRLEELQEIIEIYNEIEPNKSRCIDFEEIKANIADLRNEREIEFYIHLIVGRIENLEIGGGQL
jgi:hypothetical protein